MSNSLFLPLLSALFVTAAMAGSPPVTGTASWYGPRHHEGRTTASGCPFHAAGLTAASKSLPLGTLIRVTNRRNGLSVIVRITDRGPYVRGRDLDLSLAAARRLDAAKAGVVPVTIEVLAGPALGPHC